MMVEVTLRFVHMKVSR